MVMWLGGGRRAEGCVCKSSCTQNKGAGGWLLVLEQNLVNGRFPFTRLRLHSFCPALELTSEYLHCNQRVNHTGAGSGRARTAPRSVAKCRKVEGFSLPAQPRSLRYSIYFGRPAKGARCLLRRVPGQARVCVISSERRSGRGAEYQSEPALAALPGRALLAPAGFRRAGRARLPLPALRSRRPFAGGHRGGNAGLAPGSG